MKLEPVIGDDPRDILARPSRQRCTAQDLRSGSGSVSDLPAEVRAGTAVVVTTSGSTGVPKSVILSRDALTASALATADRIGDGAWLLALPASYVAGLQVLVRSIVADREPAWLTGAFTAQALLRRGTDDGLDRQRRARADVHLARAGAAGEAAGCRRPKTTGAGGAALVRDDPRRRPGDRRRDSRARAGCRRPRRADVRLDRDQRRMRLRRPTPARRVGADRDGEVQVAGPTLADGYLGDSAATDAAFLRDADGTRWYRTGDAGIIEDDVLRVRGRIDNVIVSGGINVSLDRVERDRPRDSRPRVRRRGRRRRRALGRGIRRGGAARRGAAAQRVGAARGGARGGRRRRSGRTRAPRGSCWSTTSRRCRAASPIVRRSAPPSPRCTESASGVSPADRCRRRRIGCPRCLRARRSQRRRGSRPSRRRGRRGLQPCDLRRLVVGVQIEMDARRIVLRIAGDRQREARAGRIPAPPCPADRG